MTRKPTTRRQFLKKFPESEPRAGLLEDHGCPQCGNRDVLHIQFTGTAEVDDDSSSDDGDHEWDSQSSCACHQCGYGGTLRDFTFKGLDDLIHQNQPHETPAQS